MENQKIVIQVAEGVSELVLREGEALDQKEPKHIDFVGVLLAPADYMENRLKQLAPENCHLLINRNAGEITFIMDEKNPYRDCIKGTLKKSAIIDIFGINKEKFYSDKELAKFFRKSEFYFSDTAKHSEIIKALMNFSAKVTTVIEKNADNRGNVKQLLDKSVEQTIPESFTMKCPIFEGYPDLEFEVLIGAEATSSDVKFYLESPSLFKLEEEYKRELIQKEVDRFTKVFNCPILYQ
jgi:hypothetical protein